MYCSECGTNLVNGASGCSKCRTEVSNPPSDSSCQVIVEPVSTSSSITKQPGELSSRSKIITVLGVLGVLAIGGSYLNYMNSSQYRIDTFNREYDAKNELERQAQTDQTESEQPAAQVPEPAPVQSTQLYEKDIGFEYAKNLARELESSMNPRCQMLAQAVRGIGYSSNPTDIKMRQIDSIIDSAPSTCFK